MIVQDVFKLAQRGTIITVRDPDIVPVIGDVFFSGRDSWAVIGIEKHGGCFVPKFIIYHFLLKSIGNSNDPVPSEVIKTFTPSE